MIGILSLGEVTKSFARMPIEKRHTNLERKGEKNIVEIGWQKGRKSENDKIMFIKSDEWCPVSFRQIARLVARLAKNEQLISSEIEHYKQGSEMFKNYLNHIFAKNWVIVPNEKIDEELDKIYYGRYK